MTLRLPQGCKVCSVTTMLQQLGWETLQERRQRTKAVMMFKIINSSEIDERRKFLQESLIAIPKHLHIVDEYAHLGKLSDGRYRQPWKRAPEDQTFLETEGRKYKKDLQQLTEGILEKYVDLYGSEENEDHIGNFDICLVSPSSVSSSPDLFSGPEYDSENSFGNGSSFATESFSKADLANFLSESCSDLRVEEMMCDGTLQENLKKLPNVSDLCKHLHPKQIKDPLSNAPESAFTSVEKFSSMRTEIEVHKALNNKRDESFGDSEDKTPYSLVSNFQEEEKELLEELLPPVASDLVNSLCMIQETKSCIPTLLEECKISYDELMQMKNLLGSETSAKVEKYDDRSISLTSVKTTINSISADLDKYLLSREDEEDLEAIPDPKMSLSLVTKYLECPVVVVDYPTELALSTSHLYPYEDLLSEKIMFLSKSKLEKIFQELWEHEKFMCDLLMLRLSEPVIEKVTDYKWISPSEVLKKIDLRSICDANLSQIEINLNWDPLLGTRVHRVKGVEALDLKITQKELNNTVVTEEKCTDTIDKFSHLELHGWQDNFLQESEQQECMAKETMVLKNKKTIGSRERVKAISLSREFSCDPVSNFLMMRSSYISRLQEEKVSRVTVKDADSGGLNHALKSSEKSDGDTLSVPVLKRSKKKPKSKVVRIELKGEYKNLLSFIEESAEPYLSGLKSSGELPYQSFSDLTTDMTRFLMKQKEKDVHDKLDTMSDTEKQGYQFSIALHILCCAKDALIHGCLEAAIATLSLMQERYQQNLKDLSRKLLDYKVELQNSNMHHPKVTSVLCNLNQVLNRSHTSPDLHSEQKILIVLRRELPGLIEHLTDVLNSSTSLKVKYQQSCVCEEIMSSLDSCNCLILLGQKIRQDFPWSQFSYVVEYEKGDDQFSELCTRQNIRYLTFTTDESVCTTNSDQDKKIASIERLPLKPVTVIGSTKVTGNTQLLQLLETRYNIVILERNYSAYIKNIPFPDIDIDERTCIVLHQLENLSEISSVERLVKDTVRLSIKYESCWVLLYFSNGNSKRYPYSGNTTESIQRFCASLDNYSTSHAYFESKVLVTTSLSETSSLVRKICDNSLKFTQSGDRDSCDMSAWITDTMTPTELLLLHFPCINAVSAALMVSKLSPWELFTKGQVELSKALPTVPTKFLKAFVHIARMSDTTIPSLHFDNKRSETVCSGELHQENSNGYDKCTMIEETKVKSPTDIIIIDDEDEGVQQQQDSIPNVDDMDNSSIRRLHNPKTSSSSKIKSNRVVSDEVRHIWPGIDKNVQKAAETDRYAPKDTCGPPMIPLNEPESANRNKCGLDSDFRYHHFTDMENISSAETILPQGNEISEEMESLIVQRFLARERQKMAGRTPAYLKNLEKSVQDKLHRVHEFSIPSKEVFEVHTSDKPSPQSGFKAMNKFDSESNFIPEISNRDFKSNLEQTTRNILRQASYNAGIKDDTSKIWKPKKNIGLAQPQRRNLPVKLRGSESNTTFSSGQKHSGRNFSQRITPTQHGDGPFHSGFNNLVQFGYDWQISADGDGLPSNNCSHPDRRNSFHIYQQNVHIPHATTVCMCQKEKCAPPQSQSGDISVQSYPYYHNTGQVMPNSTQEHSVPNTECNSETELFPKYLRNRSEFNKVKDDSCRFPNQYISVNDDHQSHFCTSPKTGFGYPQPQARSPEINYESPPMDLPYDSPEEFFTPFTSTQYPLEETSNRKRFVATPRVNPKKLKYKRDPNSKGGQTKLVFTR